MRRLNEAAEEILKGIKNAIDNLDHSQIESIIKALLEARENDKKLLLVGAGRSGLVGRAFAMRLMHLGFQVYVMGETITPQVGKGDIVIVVSGSGTTNLPVTIAEMAKKLGSKVMAITSHPDSPLAEIADQVTILLGRETVAMEEDYFSRQLLGEHESLAPMGTMFEDSCMVLFDSIVVEIMARLNISEEEMKERHAVIE
jgi:6-phospho-3-hexuloisomerase